METYDPTHPEEQNPIMVQQAELSRSHAIEASQPDGVSILHQFHQQQQRNSASFAPSQPHFTQV
jgi:hypothetical protein